MDSIEKMRRINDLTKELKQRGFAESSFEAIQQANQIYGQEDVEESVMNGMITNSSNDKIGRDTMSSDDGHNDRKISKIAESVDVLTTKLNEIIKAINDLDSRVSDLKSKHDSLSSKHDSLSSKHERMASESNNVTNSERSNFASSNPSNSNSGSQASRGEFVDISAIAGKSHESQAPVQEAHETAAAKPKDEYAFNQRTGGFQSQDVAIDKMFYFGKK